MSGYTFSITCPLCAGPLEHVTNSAPHPHVSMETRAIAWCGPCNHSFTIDVKLSSNRDAARRHTGHLKTVEHYAAIAERELVGRR